MPLSHRHRIRVRYAECDAQGHVFNAQYVGYFDLALTELWRAAFGSYGAMVEEGVDLVVAEVTARFRRPARFDEELDLDIAVRRLGTTSMATDHRVTGAGELIAEGELVHVFVETAGYGKTPIPGHLRRVLEGSPAA